ncbi:hypothetical protein Nepgr_024768 [Nepenthes gracilis]|uniref:Uncharacterized protein n=1 Tax=Nepenthes gracilis TaxID=150966 RepID=A0AAD3T3V6_NEPGR|nr:hypothetical protein Nepgr_024768 [Nepenthes gracilis]
MLFVLDVVGEILLASDGGVWFEFLDWTVVSLLDESSRIGCALVCCGVSGLVNDDDGGSLWLEITLSCGAASAGLYYTMRWNLVTVALGVMAFGVATGAGLSAITVAAWVVKLANLISNDEVWTELPMVSSTECSEIWWLKTNCCSSAGYAGGGDGPVCWASSTGDGWTTALVFEVADPSGGRSQAAILMLISAPEVVVIGPLPDDDFSSAGGLQFSTLLMALGSGSDATASGFCAEVDSGLGFLLWKYYVAVDADA